MNAALAVSIDDPRWRKRVRGADALVRRAARAARDGAPRPGENRDARAADAFQRHRNHDFRGPDQPTKGLS
ncbi:MAG: hypothetical protein ACK5XA_09005, partial [Tagaea sp.]